MNTLDAKNIKMKVRKGVIFYELTEKSTEEWNAAAVLQRQKLFLQLYGFDPETDQEARQGICRYFNMGAGG